MKYRQRLQGAAEELFEYSGAIPIIDTHEHVPRCEADYNGAEIRFGNLFNPYVSNDLASSGMPFPKDTWAAFVCIEDDWDAFAPQWRAVKYSSYARPILIALQEFYGVDDFTRENYLDVVRRINENNTPGIFQRIFREKCRIERAIRCAGDLPDRDDPILVGNISSPGVQSNAWANIETMATQIGAEPPKTLADYEAISDAWMVHQVEQGAIQFKAAAWPVEEPDRGDAEAAFDRLKRGDSLKEDESWPLMAYIRERNAAKAAELDVPMAFHTGVWGDFRTVNVQDMIGFIKRNPGTRMDLYHLGIPDVRSAIQIVKNFPNTWLNLCWAHVVASDMTVNTMKEAIDMVPMNKVFAFGADYVLFIEKVYGHLWMARENIAIVLGDRVDRNLMDLDDAKEILRAWFYDNPKAFYRL